MKEIDEEYWEEYLDKHEFQFYSEEISRKPFKMFTVNEDGEFAILIMDGAHRGYVNVYDKNGNFEYSLFFKNEDGSTVAVTWENGCVGVFFARANKLFLFGDDGRCEGVFDVLGEGYASYLEKHNCKNDKSYYAKGAWKLSPTSNELVLVESGVEENPLYSAETRAGWENTLILFIIVVIAVIVIRYIKRRNK